MAMIASNAWDERKSRMMTAAVEGLGKLSSQHGEEHDSNFRDYLLPVRIKYFLLWTGENTILTSETISKLGNGEMGLAVLGKALGLHPLVIRTVVPFAVDDHEKLIQALEEVPRLLES